MALEDLNNKLYSRDKADDRAQTENPYEPNLEENLAAQNIRSLEVDGTVWQPVHHEKTFGEKVSFWWAQHQRKVYIGAVIILLLGGIGAAGWYWFQQFFSERNTGVTITTEERVKSGEMVTAKVVARNENRTILEKVSVSIDMPDGFVPDVPLNGWKIDGRRATREVGELARDQQIEVALPGKIFGNKGAIATFKTTLHYSPAKISGVYNVGAETQTLILSSPLTVQVNAPQELITGQDLDYEVIYKNESNETLDNVRIKATFPAGFTFKEATPASSARDIWLLSTFRPGDTAKIIVRGSLSGVWNESKEARFALGYESGTGEFIAYNEGSASTRIIASPLSVSQRVGDGKIENATPGQILTYNLEYQNNSNQGYRDAVITINFENPEFLDWANLDLPQGAYNQTDKSIVWRGGEIAELRNLAPGVKGNLTFSVPIIPDFSNAGLVKNKAIVSKVTIDSPDIQATLAQNKLIGSSTLSVSLGTLVGFQMYAYANDEFIETDGPLPPEAGEKTEYILRFRVTNPANDVTQGKVTVVLPGYMKFTDKKHPGESNVSINSRTNEATWTIGSMSPGESKEVRVQIEFSPGDNMIGKTFNMIQSATFTGIDSFTKANISLPLEGNYNTLSDNEGDLPANYGTVQK